MIQHSMLTATAVSKQHEEREEQEKRRLRFKMRARTSGRRGSFGEVWIYSVGVLFVSMSCRLYMWMGVEEKEEEGELGLLHCDLSNNSSKRTEMEGSFT